MSHIYDKREKNKKGERQLINHDPKSVRGLDQVQLKQRVIHLQAEVSRYRQVVEKYQNNYHYNQLDELKEKLTKQEELLVEKDEEIAKLTNLNLEIKNHVKALAEEKSQFGDSYSQFQDQLEQVRRETERLKEENELLNLENTSLKKTVDHQEEELMKLREEVELSKKESIFKTKRATVHGKQEENSAESWFIRTLKQQNKDDK